MGAGCPNACGECCTYMLLPAPTKLLTEDYVRWLALHGCSVEFKHSAFYVRVPVKCGELLIGSGGVMRCAIYDERPQLCRDYVCEKAGEPHGPQDDQHLRT